MTTLKEVPWRPEALQGSDAVSAFDQRDEHPQAGAIV